MRANGKDDLYRTAYVLAPSHCGYTPAEVLAAIDRYAQKKYNRTWAPAGRFSVGP